MFQKILVPVDLADPDFVKPALDTAVDELDLEIVDERPPAGGR